mmetsp:Transcript_15658/g.27075  ORF Transcript_15658/g.27075 Transcript_15658/m.27075 type:complete len:257 (+) Transcript_15658:2072-2842(+)
MLPTVRSAGTSTAAEWCMSNSTRRRHTPASMTLSMRSLSPSDKYDSAQHASVNTSSSVWWMRRPRVGKAARVSWKDGAGLPRQKLDSVHVALRSMLIFEFSVSCSNKGVSALKLRTKSRHLGESPAMLPNAQTACSRTSSLGDDSSCTNMGTAPESMTTLVWSEVPDATLVSAQAASNCSCGASLFCRNSTNLGITPCLITSSIGGLRSMDSSFLNFCVASYCSCTLLLNTPATITGRSSSRCTPPGPLLLSSRAY